MTNSSVSSTEDLNAALLSQNPFAKPPNLNATDVWGKSFSDVETLNAHASNAVFQALEQISAGQYSTTSIVISAQDGTGKTHIVSRIRHRLQVQGGGLFVYAGKYGDLSQIRQGFQRILAESLGKIGSQEVTQWQELATEMTNHALKAVKPNPKFFSPKQLVERFKTSKPPQVKKFVKDLTKAFPKAKDINDPDIVKAIFWTLSDEESLYATKWLEGQELAQQKSIELELPTQRQSFDAVLQILDLISEYKELVICFDELDTPEAYDAISGLHISQIVAGLIKDMLQNLSRGLILSVMMPNQWRDKVKQLPGGVYNKVSAQGNPIELNYMDGESIVELVTLSLKNYYEVRNLVPSDPLYPFTESQLRNLGKEKPTIREVLHWCKKNCHPPIVGQVVKEDDPVETAFTKELEQEPENYLDDNFQLADALLFGFQTFIGQTVERVTIEEVTDKVCKNKTDKHLNFKIIGKENGQPVRIGVAVLQYAGGVSLSTGLGKLNDYKKFDLTRGCLVRSRAKKMTKPMESKYLEPLIREKGGEFVELKEDEIKPLIAIRAVHQKREVDYKLSEAEIIKFITEKGAEKMLGASNPLLKEILSDPSYEVPTDMIEEEPIVSEESMTADVSESDNMEEGINTLLSKINV
ncbi:AAA family ATPase [Coleofasciculus sp. FACHB-SPT36]|uniref:AAA family ATPase n=1 Tax=Cyanophyceae TaxID=3028117 RepID=UPI00168AE7C6|nr:AAA family ATPase [Coleofasciculus sp. FACHB-SPT36]MBD2540136.1 ATP-binding protein [Coleofasciculus sp. FACHB-SPT36]